MQALVERFLGERLGVCGQWSVPFGPEPVDLALQVPNPGPKEDQLVSEPTVWCDANVPVQGLGH